MLTLILREAWPQVGTRKGYLGDHRLTCVDPTEYFTRRQTGTYPSIQQDPTSGGIGTPSVGTPSDAFQNSAQTLYGSTNLSGAAAAGAGPGGMYQHHDLPALGPTTGGSSTSSHTPGVARGTGLNPAAQSFTLASHPLSSQQIHAQGYGNLSDESHYPYAQQQFSQQAQHSQQAFQSTPTTMQHLIQPLNAPHPQDQPDPSNPYGHQSQQPYWH